MNIHAIRAIYGFEMARTWRTLLQSIVSPVISTSLYFVVFGAAIGSHMNGIDGVSYGAFIVPGLIMLSLLTQSISNASFGIYFPKFVGTIYEILSAPVSPFGFIIGIWADNFEKLQLVPLLIVTPLTFLGGSFYSIHMLPPFWQKVTLFNPVVYLISGFRWSFYGVSDVRLDVSVGMTLVFLTACLALVWWIFRSGYRLKA
jgi:ABC-2 type transport system permease protein